jgi:hypothetical protein
MHLRGWRSDDLKPLYKLERGESILDTVILLEWWIQIKNVVEVL